MKKLLFILCFFCCACFGATSCKGNSSSTVTSIACSAPIAATSGDKITCMVPSTPNTSVTITSSPSLTWTQQVQVQDGTTTYYITFFDTTATATGNLTPTANFPSTSFVGVLCQDMGATGAIDTPIGTSSQHSPTNPSVSVTTTVANDVLFCGIVGISAINTTSGGLTWTTQQADGASTTSAIATATPTTATSYSCTSTGSPTNSGMGLIAYKPSGGGGGGIPNQFPKVF
jgi:hypothetical protein